MAAGTETIDDGPRTLAELRRSANVTQAQLAGVLRTSQTNVARIEKRADVKLSTLRRMVEALGGSITITVNLSDRALVLDLSGERHASPGCK